MQGRCYRGREHGGSCPSPAGELVPSPLARKFKGVGGEVKIFKIIKKYSNFSHKRVKTGKDDLKPTNKGGWWLLGSLKVIGNVKM